MKKHAIAKKTAQKSGISKSSVGGKTPAKKKKTSVLTVASGLHSATAQVDPHNNRGLANTGTNISYEGATAPGSGGSVGTGYASGKEATGEKIRTGSDYSQGRTGKAAQKKKASKTKK